MGNEKHGEIGGGGLSHASKRERGKPPGSAFFVARRHLRFDPVGQIRHA